MHFNKPSPPLLLDPLLLQHIHLFLAAIVLLVLQGRIAHCLRSKTERWVLDSDTMAVYGAGQENPIHAAAALDVATAVTAVAAAAH